VALANLVAAAAMGGVIWTIQLVHYPLFALVGADGWDVYEAAHRRRITWLVAPLMLGGVAVAVALLVERPGALTIANTVLAAGLLALTAAVFAPAHERLSATHDDGEIRRLVRLNWIRTAGWSVQVAVAIAIVA
jgi:hypothetical protein